MSKSHPSSSQEEQPAGAARPDQESGAAPAGKRSGKPQRFTAKRKMAAVRRLIAGESLEEVSRDLGVSVAQLSHWRDRALDGAESSLKTQPRDQRDDEIARLQHKLGEMTMDKELLEEKVRRLEARATSPLYARRSKK